MATVIKSPIPTPPLASYPCDWQEEAAKEERFIAELAGLAQQNGTSELLGKEIRFQRGDGYARYLVWSTQPLQLVWLELGDAWSIEPAMIRGLRLDDVYENVRRQEAINKLISQK